jgi:hypothetical protein
MEPKKTKTKTPKENSYHYWWDDKKNQNKNPLQNMNAPKKITKTQAQKLNESLTSSNHSPWNAIGTWEEKIYKVEDFQTFVHENQGKQLF